MLLAFAVFPQSGPPLPPLNPMPPPAPPHTVRLSLVGFAAPLNAGPTNLLSHGNWMPPAQGLLRRLVKSSKIGMLLSLPKDALFAA
jgi:hypothetical protein